MRPCNGDRIGAAASSARRGARMLHQPPARRHVPWPWQGAAIVSSARGRGNAAGHSVISTSYQSVATSPYSFDSIISSVGGSRSRRNSTVEPALRLGAAAM